MPWGARGFTRPSARSCHRSQLCKAGLERPHQRVDLRFGHRRGEHARTRADDAATFVVEVIEQRLESARLVGRRILHRRLFDDAAAKRTLVL